MWEWLENVGTGMFALGILGGFATVMTFLEVGLSSVVVIAGIVVIVLLACGWLLMEWGFRLHDKWLKEAFPVAWEINEQMRQDRKRR